MSEQLQRIEDKLGALYEDFHDYRVMVEGRLTKVEVRSSIFGAMSGLISGLLANIIGPNKL